MNPQSTSVFARSLVRVDIDVRGGSDIAALRSASGCVVICRFAPHERQNFCSVSVCHPHLGQVICCLKID
jgi:hypothetical protein